MRTIFQYAFLLALLSLLVGACKKKEETQLDPVPFIKLLNTSPTSVVEFQDKIVFTISYKDDDGDLGFENPDSYSIYVKDDRLPEADQYYLKPMAPIGSLIPISGELPITLQSIFILGSGNIEETTVFSIRLHDRAGNWSNEVRSPVITITPN